MASLPRNGPAPDVLIDLLAEPLLNHRRDDEEDDEAVVNEEDLDREFAARPRLRCHATNNTSQVAIIGSSICPIESLDYEMIENDFFKQDWRSRERGQIFQYVLLKWTSASSSAPSWAASASARSSPSRISPASSSSSSPT